MPMNRLRVRQWMEDALMWPGRLNPLRRDCIMNLRILEFTDKNGSRLFAQPMVLHRCADRGRRIQVCAREMFKEQCHCCEANNLARRRGDREPFKTDVRYVVNAVEIDSNSQIVKLFVLPKVVFLKIADSALTAKGAHVFEAEKGQIFSIGWYGEGLNTRYSIKLLSAKHPIDGDTVEQVVDPLTEMKHLDFEFECNTSFCNQCCKYPLGKE
ncbi:hypothetical protein ES703_17148 [subsurface metagenome]